MQSLRTPADVQAALRALLSSHLSPELMALAQPVLDDPRFWTAPASATMHHAFTGGLAEHTLEVMEGCLDIAGRNPLLRKEILLLAALWHDYAKIWDYVACPTTEKNPYGFANTAHYKRQRHLAKGYALFFAHATGKAPEALIDDISHLMLAHHGRREWGSPVEPQTQEAWALHLSDMISVDCRADLTKPETAG